MLFRSEAISPESPILKAEIIYSVTHEGARSIADVLSRRTRLSFELKDRGLSIVSEVANLISPILSWNDQSRNDSIAEYENLIQRELSELETHIKVSVNS